MPQAIELFSRLVALTRVPWMPGLKIAVPVASSIAPAKKPQ
jgi:hypothetical protein